VRTYARTPHVHFRAAGGAPSYTKTKRNAKNDKLMTRRRRKSITQARRVSQAHARTRKWRCLVVTARKSSLPLRHRTTSLDPSFVRLALCLTCRCSLAVLVDVVLVERERTRHQTRRRAETLLAHAQHTAGKTKRERNGSERGE
jgi:hypothetical protein